jgi:hypothetical protein
LLAKRDTLELIKTILLGSTVDDGIFEDLAFDAVMINCRLASSVLGLFNLPRVSSLVMNQARIVIPLVKIFEDRREDLRFLVG